MFSFLLSAILYYSVVWCKIQKAREVWEHAQLDGYIRFKYKCLNGLVAPDSYIEGMRVERE
jgi:hypothetical protein